MIIKDLFHNFVQFLVPKQEKGITHNISKIQLKSSCGFWDTTDLGLLVFYFSFKNYQEKVWSRFTKIVGFFTRNLAK
jgi:hypothetical protein